jgi:septal ring factor EnvC (AmiA/AmiB activator)
MLRAIRSAMMLGAVLPQLREETQSLAEDLKEMTRLREAISAERTRLAEETTTLSGERIRLAGLVDERKAALGQAEQALVATRLRAAELARQATSLKELIQRMENEASAAARGAEEARRADDAQRAEAAANVRARLALAPTLDPARLAPGAAFASLKGKLPYPAVGEVVRPFGAPDGFGGAEKGLSLKVRAGAAVTAPADGRIAFAGPWRSWGRLLILDAGEGYYLVLAGLARVDVEVGQFVLAGEPVGAMGEAAARAAAAMSTGVAPGASASMQAGMSAALAVGGADPILYVEFRKDGSSIDPGPWWAKRDARPDIRQDVRQDSEKARG